MARFWSAGYVLHMRLTGRREAAGGRRQTVVAETGVVSGQGRSEKKEE
jgi:hypothetical protein